jgi:hypothetical protein
VIWDLEDDPRGNIQHLAEHDVTPEEVEEVYPITAYPAPEPRAER